MAGHVYRELSPDDLYSTKVNAQPAIIVESGSSGWTGNTNLGTNSLSLYGGVRSRADVGSGSALQVYPLDTVDTHSIDKVVGIPGEYPQTGSINLVSCIRVQQPTVGASTSTRWYDTHWSAINNLSAWYNQHVSQVYPAFDALPNMITVLHVPEMFYGRQIVTGSVKMVTHAWDLAVGANIGAGPRYYTDDGIGRLFDVPSGSDWKTAWMSGSASLVGHVFYDYGLVVFNNGDSNWHKEFVSSSFNNQSGSDPNLHVQFSGSTVIQSSVFMCRMGASDVNASNNPSFLSQSFDGRVWSRMPDTRTYITAIGLYNEERQLVAVAKLAQPIRKREQDSLDIRLRIDI